VCSSDLRRVRALPALGQAAAAAAAAAAWSGGDPGWSGKM
jgi:hypothetical protein